MVIEGTWPFFNLPGHLLFSGNSDNAPLTQREIIVNLASEVSDTRRDFVDLSKSLGLTICRSFNTKESEGPSDSGSCLQLQPTQNLLKNHSHHCWAQTPW